MNQILSVFPLKIPLLGAVVGLHLQRKYLKAKQYCENPFEIIQDKGNKVQVPILDEWIGDFRKWAPKITR